MQEILVLYYSHRGSVKALAQQLARGIDSGPGLAARMHAAPEASTVCEVTETAQRLSGK